MAVYLSPGVFPREIDLSVLPSAVGPLRPAFVGTAKKGPINTPVFIATAQQALDTFGEPFAQSYLMYAVLAYLEEGNECYIVRVGIEYEAGADEALNSIAIATDGSRTFGWGRVPLFSGIDFGKINCRPVTSQTPLMFHAATVETAIYSHPLPVATINGGITTASLTITGTYTGVIDDSFIMVITGDSGGTVNEKLDGSTYEITRASDGAIVASGSLNDPLFNGISDPVALGNGLTLVVNVTAGALNTNDTFSFGVKADNRKFLLSVEGKEAAVFQMPTATYTTASAFASAVNGIITTTADDEYTVVVATLDIDGVPTEIPQFRTITAGERIQLTANLSVSSEAFALTVGTRLYAYDIPRANLIGSEYGPYNITSANNRVKIDVLGVLGTTSVEFNIPIGGSQSVASITNVIHVSGLVNGTRLFESFPLTVPGGEEVVAISTTTDAVNIFDSLIMRSNYSYVKTLRFSQTIGFNYPYKGSYRGFSDSRPTLPRSSVNDSTVPAACDSLDASYDPSQCDIDQAYYENLVGYIVAVSAGTWVNSYSISVDVYTDALGNSSDRFTVLVVDALGVAVEKFSDVSFDKTADRYIGNFLNPGTKYGGNTGAKYINWEERPAYLNNDPTDVTSYEIRNPGTANSIAFAGAQNGIPLDPVYSATIDAAIIGRQDIGSGLFAFSNKEVYDINLLITPGFSTGAVIGTAIQICESRGDVLYLVDPPFGLRPQQVVDWHNGMLISDLSNAINSSYAALYWGWIKYYDQFNVNEIWIPPSGHIAAVFSRTARTTEQWYAAAGLTRGRLLTALELEYTPSQGENDLLYGSGNAVNPICKFPQDGIVVWGNRTLQRIETALSRVNVRMLLIYLKKSMTRTLRSFVFEPNDKALWTQVNSVLNPFLADIQSRRGITAYKIVCDETNNTPERIDRNELWVSVFIKPTRSVEFIVLNLAVVSTGANFSSEAVLSAGGIVTSATSV